MGRWVVAIAGAVVGALFFGWLLQMLGVTGILYTVGVLVGSAVTSSLAGTLKLGKLVADRGADELWPLVASR